MNIKERQIRATDARDLATTWWRQPRRRLLLRCSRCCRQCAARRRADHQRQLDLRQARQPAGRRRLHRRQVRPARPGDGRGGRGEGQRHPRLQHLPRRGEHADPGGAPRAGQRRTQAAMLQPDDVAAAVLFIATLPAHVAIPSYHHAGELCVHLSGGPASHFPTRAAG